MMPINIKLRLVQMTSVRTITMNIAGVTIFKSNVNIIFIEKDATQLANHPFTSPDFDVYAPFPE